MALNAAALAPGNRAVFRVYGGYQFTNYKRFALESSVAGVLEERAHTPIGQYNDHGRPAPLPDTRIKHPHVIEAVQFIVAGSVQVVNHRVVPVCLWIVARWQVYAIANIRLVRLGVKRVMCHTIRQLARFGFVDPDRERSTLLLWCCFEVHVLKDVTHLPVLK